MNNRANLSESFAVTRGGFARTETSLQVNESGYGEFRKNEESDCSIP